MITKIWNYNIKTKEEPTKYEQQKIKDSLFIGYKNGIVKTIKRQLEWKVNK